MEDEDIITGIINVADDSILVPSPSKGSEKLRRMIDFQIIDIQSPQGE